MHHARDGTLRTSGVVPTFSRTPARVRGPAPAMGQHNDAVYGDELGLDAARRAELKARNII
jgi:formyl-CoA transferase